MTDRYALWAPPEAALEAFLQDMLGACSTVITRCLDEMPRERMLWVDFEDLRTAPREVVHRVLRFLKPNIRIDDAAIARSLDRALAQVPVHDGSRAPMPVEEPVRRLAGLMAAARHRFSNPPG